MTLKINALATHYSKMYRIYNGGQSLVQTKGFGNCLFYPLVTPNKNNMTDATYTI